MIFLRNIFTNNFSLFILDDIIFRVSKKKQKFTDNYAFMNIIEVGYELNSHSVHHSLLWRKRKAICT